MTKSFTIGDKDKEGNILILGGWIADLWITSGGTYLLKHPERDFTMETPKEAIRAYNLSNKTNLETLPNLPKPKLRITPTTEGIRFESSRHLGVYYFVHEVSGEFFCTCPGWGFRKTCSHIDAVEGFLESLEKGGPQCLG